MLKEEKQEKNPLTKFIFEGFGAHQEFQPLDQFFCALMKNFREALC